MQAPRRTRFKICCISSIDEAKLAVAYGASAVGLVASMPSGPGVIGESLIAEIAMTIPPGVASFLLTSHQNVSAIIDQHRQCGVNTIQIVDQLTSGTHQDLRDALPGVGLVQVIHVLDEDSIDEARQAASHVNAILLDSGNPKLATKELGGTGRTHNWEISRSISDAVNVPVYLAGGLNPNNVADAIARVRPFGVDICSGVRTDGQLDEAKLAAFCKNVMASG